MIQHEFPEILTSIEMKKINRQKIFDLIYWEGPLSKQQIATTLNLSTPTVTQNLKELEQIDLIMEDGFFASTGGRKAKAISYRPDARYAVGLDLTANHISIVIINLRIDVIIHHRIRLRFENTDKYFQTVGDLVQQTIGDANIDQTRILGVGISVPAHVAKDNHHIIYAPILEFTGGNIDSFAQYIPYPCHFINDANAACMAEYWNVNDLDNIVYLSLSNSVGGAILLNNAFYPGENQRSAEFGHITLVPDGRQCYCGQKGCVDAYCNAKLLSDSCYGDLALFFENLSHGSPAHIAIWQEYLDHLAIAVNTLRTMFDCKIVLGGYVGGHMGDHLPELQQKVASLNSFDQDGSYLHICRYKFEASAVGAALQYISAFMKQI